MARQAWLVDPNRLATKILSASSDPKRTNWKSNPTKACPNCQYRIDNSDVTHEWPGLPRGVKFDPSDQEIVWHLIAKIGAEDLQPHPFIDEFIPTVDEDEGICYTHPQNLPGIKMDGSCSHFFHRAIKAYNTGTRKRRKIHGDNFGDVRWHKTGRTKPVLLDGVQKGCKKIMVLYVTPAKGDKPEKTNWVMHQYHLGTSEDERDGEYVISKVYYQQQQQVKHNEKSECQSPKGHECLTVKVDPVTPKSVTPEPPLTERRFSSSDAVSSTPAAYSSSNIQEVNYIEDHMETPFQKSGNHDLITENQIDEMEVKNENENEAGDDPKWYEIGSQNIMDSQQLAEYISLCDEFILSQSPNREDQQNHKEKKCKARLSDHYACLGAEVLKKDLEECQDYELDQANIILDTPPDFRLSQLDFPSQDSFVAFGGHKIGSEEQGD
ncbi:PREDICTED: NAC domain-containing protein 8-like isoform X2 [Ipomoea nil]|uniref:NAC domain-containing protein 8-like isoform X2 n=1 Tax=Ipomoea nil TaxID=35883 RepID=UPI0009014B6C|nr:PREDICTED: NAC domain-containing protein 8-like isoform X2 [Ipomoea nil]